MANAPTPFRSPDPSIRLDNLEARLSKIEKASKTDTLGMWIFRAVVGALLVGLVAMVVGGFHYWLRQPPTPRPRLSATQRIEAAQRRSDEAACAAIDGEFVQRVNDDLICGEVGIDDRIVIFQTHVGGNGNRTVKVVVQP